MTGSPDWQQITEWFGPVQDQGTAVAIGAGTVTLGPYDLTTYASVIVAVKPSGGTISGTITQTIPGGPAALTDVTTFTVLDGVVGFEAVVLLAGQVSITLQGSAGGETVTYAVVPANTNINTNVTSGGTVLNIVPTPLASWPPSSPADGDLRILELPTSYDPTASKKVSWLLRYDAGSTQWDFLGGAPLIAEVNTDESTTSGAYAALATAGPAVVLPRAGDYIVEPSCTCYVGALSANAYMSYDIGATGAVDADAAVAGQGNAGNNDNYGSLSPREKAGLTAVTLTAKYKSGSAGNAAHFFNRRLRVVPVRIS